MGAGFEVKACGGRPWAIRLVLNGAFKLFTEHVRVFPFQSALPILFPDNAALDAEGIHLPPAGSPLAALRSSRARARSVSCNTCRSRIRALCSCDFELPIEQFM